MSEGAIYLIEMTIQARIRELFCYCPVTGSLVSCDEAGAGSGDLSEIRDQTPQFHAVLSNLTAAERK